PFIKIITKNIKIDESNLKELFTSYDIVCEAFDKADQKAMLINGILQNFPDKKIVSGSGMAGYDSSNKISTKKALKNLFICGDLEAEARVGMGLMAPRVTICAAHQANMILRLILDIYDV
ncbi:MAG TPA: sulfur carrier protein ThiS adenylyltransferase ThiF, partial [Arcobacter skirrowii]|nr:sulfur carrier protein ThiS adenylyltransferase ThiF [Aliarcobacter skirrowii]